MEICVCSFTGKKKEKKFNVCLPFKFLESLSSRATANRGYPLTILLSELLTNTSAGIHCYHVLSYSTYFCIIPLAHELL